MGHMPGYGDAASWGAIKSSRDPRADAPDDEARIKALASELFSERIASVDWINEAQCNLSHAEATALSAAVRGLDDAESGRLLRNAVRRVLREGANRDAETTIKTGVRP